MTPDDIAAYMALLGLARDVCCLIAISLTLACVVDVTLGEREHE